MRELQDSLEKKEIEIVTLKGTIGRMREDELKRAGMLQSAFVEYLRPTGV